MRDEHVFIMFFYDWSVLQARLIVVKTPYLDYLLFRFEHRQFSRYFLLIRCSQRHKYPHSHSNK